MMDIQIKPLSELAILAGRERIIELERTLIDEVKAINPEFTPGNTDDICPVTHHWAPGLYAREIFLPKDSLIIGKIHKHAHVNTISKGSVSVATPFGVETLHAPISFVSKPGTKRAVYAHEDTIWTTYHPTDKTTVEEVEAEIISKSFADFELIGGDV